MAHHQIERVRHDTRRRILKVETVAKLTPHMLRIGFTGDDLHDFVSLSADDHIKLFFQTADEAACMRDYTPRGFDTALEAVMDLRLGLIHPLLDEHLPQAVSV